MSKSLAAQIATKRYKQSDKGKAQLKRLYDKRKSFIDELKDQPCLDCKNKFPPECMDFDHVRGKKFKVVSTLKTYSLERILKEIEKCDLVCANCHRTRTNLRRLNNVEI